MRYGVCWRWRESEVLVWPSRTEAVQIRRAFNLKRLVCLLKIGSSRIGPAMKPDMKDRFRSSWPNWKQSVLGTHPPQFGASPDEDDLVSYRARQERLMQ